MITVDINPEGVTDQILTNLNACFPGWGGNREYAWTHDRTVGAPRGDVLVLRDDGQLLAGSSVIYRNFETATGRKTVVATTCASWTSPQARGRGCFTRLFDESVTLIRRKGVGLVISYVTETNASCHVVRRAGAALFPTQHLISTDQTPAVRRHPPYRTVDADAEALFAEFERRRAPARMMYANAAEWAGQFLDRPDPTEVVAVDGAGWAVVETRGDFDRIQALAPIEPDQLLPLTGALLDRAHRAGRRLFVFDPVVARAQRTARTLGLSLTPGYITVIAADQDAARDAVGVEPTREALVACDSLARWGLQTGDRM